jgi:hypothetical protein
MPPSPRRRGLDDGGAVVAGSVAGVLPTHSSLARLQRRAERLTVVVWLLGALAIILALLAIVAVLGPSVD